MEERDIRNNANNNRVDKRVDEIKRDIEVTRDTVGDTIEKITNRLSAHYVKERVKEATAEKTKDVIATTTAHAREWGNSVGTNVKAHPGWYAAGGAGAGGLLWLLLRRKHKDGGDGSGAVEPGPQTFGIPVEPEQSAAGLQRKAANMKGRIGGSGRREPLVFGAFAFLLGAMLGFMLPESVQEREWVRKTRELQEEWSGTDSHESFRKKGVPNTGTTGASLVEM